MDSPLIIEKLHIIGFVFFLYIKKTAHKKKMIANSIYSFLITQLYIYIYIPIFMNSLLIQILCRILDCILNENEMKYASTWICQNIEVKASNNSYLPCQPHDINYLCLPHLLTRIFQAHTTLNIATLALGNFSRTRKIGHCQSLYLLCV